MTPEQFASGLVKDVDPRIIKEWASGHYRLKPNEFLTEELLQEINEDWSDNYAMEQWGDPHELLGFATNQTELNWLK